MDDVRTGIIALLPRLRRFAFALTRDLDLADDLVQETCTRALTHQDQWKPGTRLDSWMFKIAQNLWLDQRRSPRFRRETTLTADIELVAGEDGRRTTEGRLTLDDIVRRMAQLPREHQVLVALVCVEGMSYKEAAHHLGIPIGTVMSRLSAARKALVRMIDEAPPVRHSVRERVR